MEDRAYSFLESYINRIDTYAKEQEISKDILEDIKYNIIEKLYTSPTPIKEAFVSLTEEMRLKSEKTLSLPTFFRDGLAPISLKFGEFAIG